MNSSPVQMHSFQNHYGNSGHFSHMYQQNQRSSFAIQELLGLGNPACRQNTSPEMDPQNLSPGNLVYISRDYPMYSHGNYNGPNIHQESMIQSYANIREPTPQHQAPAGSPFCPWRFDPLPQTPAQNQPLVQTMTSVMPRHVENVPCSYKMSHIHEQGKKCILCQAHSLLLLNCIS